LNVLPSLFNQYMKDSLIFQALGVGSFQLIAVM